MKKISTILALLLVCAGAFCQTFTWQNPISDGIDPKGIRDCQVFRDGDYWYMTGTAYPFWLKQENATGELNPGVPLYRSEDLLHWDFRGYLIERPGPDKWYYRRFWAPEINKIGGKYYLTFNCRNDELGYDGQYCGYAVADNVEGPYTIVTEKGPLTIGNDITLFRDDDGTVWAFWDISHADGIFAAPIDLEKGRFTAEPLNIIRPGASGEWDEVGLEGACVFKRNGIYYLMYSSWTRGYEMGYATATSIRGPWTKSDQNPFYGAIDRQVLERRQMMARGGVPGMQPGQPQGQRPPQQGMPPMRAENRTPDGTSPFVQVGHNQVFTGPDGRLWLSCHGNTREDREVPMLVIDPIEFGEDGMIARFRPSYMKTTVPTSPGQVEEAGPVLSQIKDPRIFKGDGKTAYRDPAILYDKGTFYLYFSLMRTEGEDVYSYVAQSRSSDLVNWTEPEIITERDQNLDFSSPGNVIRYGNRWIMCLQTYPRPGYKASEMPRYGNQDARLYTMESEDLVHWSKPRLMMVKGDDVPEKDMGRMLDPYLIEDKENPGKWYCLYKQRGLSFSSSTDLVHWKYEGNIQSGENPCVILDGDRYVLFHSPTNGVAVKKSRNLVDWGPDEYIITLGQNRWDWAWGRLSAGAVLDCRGIGGIGKYIMVFHGSGPLTESEGDFDKNSSLGIAWSGDLENWSWPGKR